MSATEDDSGKVEPLIVGFKPFDPYELYARTLEVGSLYTLKNDVCLPGFSIDTDVVYNETKIKNSTITTGPIGEYYNQVIKIDNTSREHVPILNYRHNITATSWPTLKPKCFCATEMNRKVKAMNIILCDALYRNPNRPGLVELIPSTGYKMYQQSSKKNTKGCFISETELLCCRNPDRNKFIYLGIEEFFVYSTADSRVKSLSNSRPPFLFNDTEKTLERLIGKKQKFVCCLLSNLEKVYVGIYSFYLACEKIS